ncbi:Putative major facilitator, sugar transporter, major facilitator superfamily [Colletotrichum destructivum]|uniref:Major facilitator, sugar transporter, major facilitator superfamily n=1 Tax=Colletotrichum destructivum TaxID=34406 RepID=A0AAX4I038_9PEZI|nr:Putative major facilitator, sugar transporter, major facilitator superfamily [Colletotrichum destructivum]
MATHHDGYEAEKVDSNAKHLELSADSQLAQAADFEDHELGIWKSLVRYPWASAWCVYACWTIILLSFDVQAAGAVVGIPEFRKDFGYAFEGDYVLPAVWQSSFSGAPVATAVISSIASAELADLIGRKKVLALALLISFVAVTIEFIATTNAVFFAGKLLNGLMVGAVGTIMVSYIGEITPLALRGIFTCGVGVAYGIGPLVAFIVINYTGTVQSRWAYRTVFCCQFGFAGVAAILWPFMPESPWWLVSKGKKEEALKSLGRLGHTGNEGRAKLALIERTLEEVREETEGVTYVECFKKSNLRRTIISIMPLIIQAFSGIAWVAGYFTYYLQLAGYSTSMSYQLQIAQPVLSIVGNLMAAAVIDRVGRRNLTFYGLGILTAFLLITGGLGTGTTQPMIKGTVAFILIYSWWYNVSIGSTAFSLLAETSTSRLRAKTVAIGYASQNSINVMWQFVIPYMFNPDKANLGAKIAFIFGGLCFFSLLYLWYFQPETGGRSYEELDEMFKRGVPARKFKTYKSTMQIRNEAAAQGVGH